MTSQPAIQDRYPEGFSHCYGCGRLNPHGHALKSRPEGDEVVARFRPKPEHTSLPGFVYGGLIASLIDCHAMATAAARAERDAGTVDSGQEAPRYVTAALHVDYLRPTPIDAELVIRGHVSEVGSRKMVVKVSVTAGGQETARGESVAVPMPRSMASS